MTTQRTTAIDPLSRVINLPASSRRILAAMLFLIALVAIILLFWSAFSAASHLQSELEDKRLVAGRLQAIASLKPALQHGATDTLPIGDSDFFPGETEAVTRAAIQTRLNQIAVMQGATLLSVSNAPPRQIEGTNYIGMRADLTGTVDVIHNTVFEIETTRPSFIVREATIWTNGDARGTTLTSAPELSAQLHIYVPLRPDLHPLEREVER